MGFWSSIGSTISSVGSAIGSLCSSIGSAVSSFVTGVGTVLGDVLSALEPVAAAMGKFANAFLQGVGILKPDENTEELGDRALQAKDNGITMDKFDNFEDYMGALRDFKLDPELSTKRGTAEKLVAGMAVGTVGVEDKFNAERGSLNGLWLLPMANPDYFTPDRMQTMISTGRLRGDVFAYLEKRLSGGETRSFEKKFEINPAGTSMSNQDLDTLYNALEKARNNFSDMTKLVENHNNAR